MRGNYSDAILPLEIAQPFQAEFQEHLANLLWFSCLLLLWHLVSDLYILSEAMYLPHIS